MPEVPTQPQPIQKLFNWKNILIGIIIGGLLVGVVMFIYYNTLRDDLNLVVDEAPENVSTISAKPTQPKDETANWKTYQKSDVGFQLKYPSSVSTESTAYSSGSGGYATLSIKGPTQKEGTDIHDGMYIFTKTLAFVSSLENVAKEDQESIKSNEYGILVTVVNPKPKVSFDIKQVTIGEANGVSQTIVIDGKKIDDKFIYVRLKDGKVLRIHRMSVGANYVEYSEIIDKILSTFKFLD